MARRTPSGRTVGDVLNSAMAAPASEYLLNGMRYICQFNVRMLPSGTTGNEALNAEVNRRFANMRTIRGDRLKLGLRLFKLAKMLSYASALTRPCTRQYRQGELLHRLVGQICGRLAAELQGPSSALADGAPQTLPRPAHAGG